VQFELSPVQFVSDLGESTGRGSAARPELIRVGPFEINWGRVGSRGDMLIGASRDPGGGEGVYVV
jgi:hypothetical protein